MDAGTVQDGSDQVRDEELVEQARNGDQSAFGRLVVRHQSGVFNLALRLVGERETARDVAQETFLRAWRGLPRFRSEARFSTWIYRITVNTASNHRARLARHRTNVLDEASAPADLTVVAPEDAAESLGLRDELLDALGSLSRRQRAVVVLKDVLDWSHAEIAEALGITVTAAKVRLHRARARLREELTKGRR